MTALFHVARTLAAACVALTLVSCGNPSDPAGGVAARMPGAVRDALVALQAKRVYFGHQSVGSNVVEGLEALRAANGNVGPRPVKTSDPGAIVPGVWAHDYVGSNGDPKGKLADFAARLEHLGARLDIAFAKFCYVDVNSQTDVADLFASYRGTLEGLRTSYPSIAFVAFTIPLMTAPDTENARRNEYNRLVRAYYGGGAHGPFFDLASVEANGVTSGGSDERLDPALSSDGGHLNADGQRLVAEALVRYLASLR